MSTTEPAAQWRTVETQPFYGGNTARYAQALPTGTATLALAHPLTDRDKEMLLKLAEGKAQPQIAQEMYVSLSTVNHTLVDIQRKLRTTSNMQSVYLAAKHGII